jgi:hypothetical protein
MAKTWEATAGSTDFVITTVNVPDRLDIQEVRAREDEDDDRTERFYIDWYAIRTWIVRLAVIGLIGAAGLFAWESASPLREELSAARIAERLSQATGQPVKVGETGFRFTPTPRFVVSDIEVGNVWRSSGVAIHFNWEDAWRAVRGGGWIWGEASVAPTTIEAGQGEFLVRTLSRLSASIPLSISTIRFESVELKGVRQLSGAFEGVARRNAEGLFSAVTLRSREGNTTLSASLVPRGEAIGVQFDSTGWQATVGPAVTWNEAHASLRLRPGLVEIPEFLLTGFGGSVKGSVYAASDVEWAITGVAAGTGFDIEMILQPPGVGGEGQKPTTPAPLSGTASTDLLLAGRGPTLNEAIGATVATGPVRVRWAALQGINLGYVASRPGSQSGGVTRFTELTSWVSAGPAGIAFQDVTGRAGALAAYGEVAISPDRRLSGSLRVDLGGARIQAPLNVQVRGTLRRPEFGR